MVQSIPMRNMIFAFDFKLQHLETKSSIISIPAIWGAIKKGCVKNSCSIRIYENVRIHIHITQNENMT